MNKFSKKKKYIYIYMYDIYVYTCAFCNQISDVRFLHTLISLIRNVFVGHKRSNSLCRWTKSGKHQLIHLI